MKKLRIGVVGLGGIAQKAWLPVLAAASDWTLQGHGRQRARKLYPFVKAGAFLMPIRYLTLLPVAMQFLSTPAPPVILKWSVRY